MTSPAKLRQARKLIRKLLYLPMRTRAYVRAAEIYRKARRQGRTVRSSVDCMIAACAIDHGIPVLHRDRDYDIIAGVSALRIIRP